MSPAGERIYKRDEGTLKAEKSSEETKEQENRQLKEKTDKKMIIGWIILIGVMAAIGGGFWSTVADQAEQMRQEEARQEEQAVTAMYIETGMLVPDAVFVDMENQTVFTAEVPEEGIYNKNNKREADGILEHGDVVKITGDGAMTMSIPAQYPGVTKMQVLRRGNTKEMAACEKAAEDTLS